MAARAWRAKHQVCAKEVRGASEKLETTAKVIREPLKSTETSPSVTVTEKIRTKKDHDPRCPRIHPPLVAPSDPQRFGARASLRVSLKQALENRDKKFNSSNVATGGSSHEKMHCEINFAGASCLEHYWKRATSRARTCGLAPQQWGLVYTHP
jgi:hypothetical protein